MSRWPVLRPGAWRLAALCLATVLGMVLWAQPAAGHAALVASDPEPGAQLNTTPGVVTLRFSEPLVARLSEARVSDPDGRVFRSEPGGDQELRIRLATTALGVYEVHWRTVSPLDGHTLRGSFRFGVGTSPGPGAEGTVGTGPSGDDLAIAVGRFVEYAAVLLAMGMLLVGELALRPPALRWVRVRPGWAVTAALAGGLVVVVGEALLAVSSVSGVPDFFGSRQGLLRLGRLGAEGAALAALWRGRHRMGAGFLALAVLGLAASGHAAAEPAWFGISVTAGHLVGAGLWAGGVLALATLRPPGGWRAGEGRQLLERFVPVAAVGFLATVALGAQRTVQELAGPGDLLDTSYGRVLLVKVLGVVAMVPLSMLAWQRMVRSRLEGALTLLVVAAAALLAAYPLPPQRAAEAVEAAAAPERSPALPRAGDLTLGGDAGDALVGLTVRPATPGRNDLLVEVQPIGGEDAAEGLDATLRIDDASVALDRCGPTCWRGAAALTGGEHLEVSVPGPAGGGAGFVIPELPASDAATLLEQATARMRRLGTYRIEEVFRPADPTLRSEYTIQVPDRLRFAIRDGRVTVRIGTTRYTQPSPGEPWEVTTRGPAVEVPVIIWDSPNPVATRVLGRTTVAGTETTEISFFIEVNQSPIWYRLWIADDGLVHRAQMRTRGHFMDHRYLDFDAPLRVEAPQ